MPRPLATLNPCSSSNAHQNPSRAANGRTTTTTVVVGPSYSFARNERAPAGGARALGRPELLVMVGAIPCWTLLYEIHDAPRALRFRMADRAVAPGNGKPAI